FRRQSGKKRLHLPRAQLLRMALAIGQDETPDPAGIGLLGTDAVMPEADPLPDLIKQSRRLGTRYTGCLRGVTHRAALLRHNTASLGLPPALKRHPSH